MPRSLHHDSAVSLVDPGRPASRYDAVITQLTASGALLYGFDAAFPAPASVYAGNGGVAVNVYVSGQYAQSAQHVAALRSAGLGPWPGYERGIRELISDRAAGRQAGSVGIGDAIRCGFPADGSIWFPFSVDTAVAPSEYPAVGEAFRGIQDVNAGRYRISLYGQGDLARWLRAQGIIRDECWLSASTSFPGWDAGSPDICIWQQIGNYIPGYSTDRNVITDAAALKAWWPDGSPYGGGMTGFGFDSAVKAEEVWEVCHFLGSAFKVDGKTGLRKPGEFGEALRVIFDGKLVSDAEFQTAMAVIKAAMPVVPSAQQIAAELVKLLPPSTVALSAEQLAAIGAAAGRAAAAAIQPPQYLSMPVASSAPSGG